MSKLLKTQTSGKQQKFSCSLLVFLAIALTFANQVDTSAIGWGAGAASQVFDDQDLLEIYPIDL